MRKILSITTAVLAAAVLSGCGDRGGDCNSTNGGSSIVYKDPTAIIDLNSTDHTYSTVTDAYTVGTGARNKISSPFIFIGSRSQDNDENNSSITSYAWDIKFTHNPNCVDINKTGSIAIFKFIHTDTNNTCLTTAITPGEINATLTVTDDEGKTATTTKSIKTN